MSEQLSNNYALLIGVGKCAYPEWSLPVTVKDIQALKSLLVDPKCGYIDDDQHLRLLHDEGATSQGILDGLNWLSQQAASDSDATVLVYYSGHGWLEESTEKYYLIPHNIKPYSLAKSALPAETFNNALRQIQAKRLLIIIDSCHAGGMATAKDEPTEIELPDNFVQTALPKNLIDELNQGAGRAVFTSSTEKQQSWIRRDGQMSIYTYHFLEALQGAGNKPGDKFVQVSDLMKYLGKAVPASAQRERQVQQTPFYNCATEDFAVALLQGGKGLPSQGWEGVKAEAQKNTPIISETTESAIATGDNNTVIRGSYNNKIDKGRDITISNVSSNKE